MDLARARAVAAQDFLDVSRARLVQGVAAMYVLFVTLVFGGFALADAPSVAAAIQITQGVVVLFVPLVALIAAYLAVAGERESGTIRFLLGYPVSRAEMVVGKLASRLGIVLISILAGFLIGTVVVLVEYPEPNLGQLWGFAALTMLFALSYVGVAMGVSALTASRSRAMTLVIAFYFLFTVIWSAIPALISFGARYLFDVELQGTLWQLFVNMSPPSAYGLTLSLLPGQISQAPPTLGGSTGIVILLLWTVVPLLVGYWRFESADVE